MSLIMFFEAFGLMVFQLIFMHEYLWVYIYVFVSYGIRNLNESHKTPFCDNKNRVVFRRKFAFAVQQEANMENLLKIA